MTLESAETRRRLRAAAVALLAVTFALANGMDYGAGNLRQYLLHGLRAADPGFLANDWFAAQTTPVHPLFTWIVAAFARLGPIHVLFGLANAVFAVIFVVCVYGLIARFYDRPILTLATALILFTFTPVNALGWSYILHCYFQPSTIGGVGLLAGCVLLIHRRHVAATGALVLGGCFHAGYAVWTPSIVFAVVIADRASMSRHAAGLLLGAAAIPLCYHAPFLVAGQADPAILDSAAHVLQQVYIPEHYAPRTWGAAPFFEFAATLAVGAFAALACPPARRLNRPAIAILVTMTVVVLVGIALTAIVRIPFVAALFPYRLAPFLRLAAFVAASAALIECAASNRQGVLRAAGVCTGLCVGLHYFAGLSVGGIGFLVKIVALATICRLRDFNRLPDGLRTRLTPAVAAAAVLLAATWHGHAGAKRKDLFGRPPAVAEQELYDWCRAETDPDAVFVIPPGHAGFRLGAARAVVADWKCMPVVPSETLEWRRRLAAVSGGFPDGASSAEAGFLNMDAASAARLARAFGARYLLVRRSRHVGDLDGVPRVFSNAQFAVHDLGRDATGIAGSVATLAP